MTASARPNVIALVDGEHHPGVVRDALEQLARDSDIQAVLFVGGQEKLDERVLEDPPEHFGFDVELAEGDPAGALRRLTAGRPVAEVVDLSGEPILDGDLRMQLACVALDAGVAYRSADTRISPPSQLDLESRTPILSVIGTGKRTGKTALGGHLARLLKQEGRTPVVVSMGRGGPPTPELVRADQAPDLESLLALARSGRHAASDYLEDAVLAGVATVGCRRCGEGLAGQVFDSNVVDGARLALNLQPDVVVVEGSGAAFPPVAADRTICVTSTTHAPAQALSYLGPLRLGRADLVVVLGESLPDELRKRLEYWCADALIAARLRAEPARPLEPDARVAVFTTATDAGLKAIGRSLADQGIEPVVLSNSLARRSELREQLCRAQSERCDVYLTELKAAAIDTVAEQADQAEAAVEFLRNRPVALEGEPDLDAQLLLLADSAVPA